MINKIVNISPGLFRLLLAFIVVVFHSVDFLTIGHAAVYIFFVLSGYWIFRMYSEKYVNFKNAYWVYIRSRLWRIFPIYWLILVFSIGIHYFLSSVGFKPFFRDYVISNFILLGEGINNAKYFIGSAWSLDIELQFYLIAPLLLYFLMKRGGLFLIISFGFVLVSYIYNYSLFKLETILLYLPYFILGGMIYKLKLKSTSFWALTSLLVSFSFLGIHYLYPELKALLFDKNPFLYGVIYQEYVNIILTILILPFLIYNIHQVIKRRELDAVLSSMSYVIYLLHWPLLQVYAYLIDGVSLSLKFLYLLSYYIITILLSYIISISYDNESEKRRRAWLKLQVYKTNK
ncbi:acyltransferase family protein [Leeuwenhoekiella sp. MAR_2009_132]|uniref:acyltransferase family protein n=1 Tax=Leeuwenhoekiella sp. MAR_2009_132 TaxID=1392489 RepID=UPI00048EC38E|nr:acyltransferase [Leeuwenhoekiella sp. MAR_2009_132]